MSSLNHLHSVFADITGALFMLHIQSKKVDILTVSGLIGSCTSRGSLLHTHTHTHTTHTVYTARSTLNTERPLGRLYHYMTPNSKYNGCECPHPLKCVWRFNEQDKFPTLIYEIIGAKNIPAMFKTDLKNIPRVTARTSLDIQSDRQTDGQRTVASNNNTPSALEARGKNSDRIY